MFKSLINNNEKRSQFSMMAQYLNTCFMISTIENEYLVNIEKGVVNSELFDRLYSFIDGSKPKHNKTKKNRKRKRKNKTRKY